jgi:hypothetical protein
MEQILNFGLVILAVFVIGYAALALASKFDA